MTFSLLIIPTLLVAQNITSVTYENEKPIIFETQSGNKTDAYQGMFQVPENRANPKSRLIPIHYVRFPATGKTQGSPIVYLSGGPGGSGINTAKYRTRYQLFMDLREAGDVIALDQRGTGASRIVPRCVSSHKLPMAETISADKLSAIYRDAGKECIGFWQSEGVDVFGYNTLESARDLEDLRKHLRAKKITLWGISYGTHLALASLKVIESSIDKLILASAEGLNQTVKLPARTDDYFDRVQAAINTQPKVAKQFPDIKSLMRQVHHQLEKEPLKVKASKDNGLKSDLLFQKTHLQMITSGMIADPTNISYLLALYRSLDQRDDSVLQKVLKFGYFNDDVLSFDVMSFSMDVASGITDNRLSEVNQQAKQALLGDFLNFPMPHLNRLVEGIDLGDSFRERPVSDIPTLLLSGTLDGRTYIESQIEATQGLSRLTKVTVLNAGHNLFMASPQVTQVIQRFLKNEKVETQVIDVPLPSFELDNSSN